MSIFTWVSMKLSNNLGDKFMSFQKEGKIDSKNEIIYNESIDCYHLRVEVC